MACALCATSVSCASALQAGSVSAAGSEIRPPSTAKIHPLKSAAPDKPPRTDAQTPDTHAPSANIPSAHVAAKPIARSASVVLSNGMLTVKADNSDLNQILKSVAAVSGMKIDGSVKSTPVYGIYGPLDPRDVLTALLTGSGYNFMMVGVSRQGAPQELRLTLQHGGPSPPEPQAAAAAAEAAPVRASAPAASTPEPELGPGAVGHVPPPPPDSPEERMQQNLRRLQQMQDKLMQQKPPQ